MLLTYLRYVRLATFLTWIAGSISAAPTFPLHTAGPLIVDADGHRVRLNAVSWYGAESADFVVGGLQANSLGNIVQQIKNAGFNAVRLPWSNQLYESNPTVGSYALTANSSLVGQSALSILDQVISSLANAGLMVILDNHNSNAEWCCTNDGNELWYNGSYPESSWISDWQGMAARYASQPYVIGVDIRNEPRGSATWGGSASTDWHAAAQRGGNAVLSVNSNLLIFVEGVNYALDLSGAANLPIVLNTANRLVYSAHDYGFNYSGLSSYEGWVSRITPQWGYLLTGSNPQPFWLGEFGTCNTSDTCVASSSNADLGYWFQFLTTYLSSHSADWSYWDLNGTESSGRDYGSTETYGILNSGWTANASAALSNRLQQLALSSGGPPSGTYQILNVGSGLAADVTGQSTSNGAAVAQWPYWGGPNQVWRVTPGGAGTYKIVNSNSGLALDIAGRSTSPGTTLQQWAYWGGGNQQFVISQTASGSYRIVNATSGLAIEVPSFSKVNGTVLDQWPLNGGANQQWLFQAP